MENIFATIVTSPLRAISSIADVFEEYDFLDIAGKSDDLAEDLGEFIKNLGRD